MGKVLFFVGLAGMLLSLCVLGVSVMLPVANAPRTSWSEAMWGIVPGAFCSFIFLALALGGLILWMNQKEAVRRRSRDAIDEP